MVRKEYEKKITIEGNYRIFYQKEKFTQEFFSDLKKISDKLENGELAGIAINSFYGIPVFFIDSKIYLLWDCIDHDDSTELYFVKPYDFKYWQSVNEFIYGLLD